MKPSMDPLRKSRICLGLLWPIVSTQALAEGPLVIRSMKGNPKGFDRVFAKQIDVFGLAVCATRNVSDNKALHAAAVLAQYLDNDADGKPDNNLVINALRRNKGMIFMFASERAFEKMDIHRHIRERVWDNMLTVGLFADETWPGGSKPGQFDATLEEVLHLVTSGGYSVAYPKVFGERPGTAIACAMDKDRGGHFLKVPCRYPSGAWYSYDDRSCDYACQITEYFYWGLTSLLGAQNYPGRGQEIGREWKLNTAGKLKTGDPDLFGLLTDPQYRFPQRLPDGRYRPPKRTAVVGSRRGPCLASSARPWSAWIADDPSPALRTVSVFHFSAARQTRSPDVSDM